MTLTDQHDNEPIIIPCGGLQQWLTSQGRQRRDQYFQDWLTKAIHAAKLAEGEPWPAWSTGEVLAVALIVNRADVLAGLDYTEDWVALASAFTSDSPQPDGVLSWASRTLRAAVTRASWGKS